MRAVLILALALLTMPAFADDDDHNHDDHEEHAEHDHDDHDEHAHDDDDSDHLSELDGIRILHGWTTATEEDHAHVYVEIENNRDTAVSLTGAETNLTDQTMFVGAPLNPNDDPVTIPQIDIAAGSEFDLSPETVYIELEELSAPLSEGDEFDIVLVFGEEEVELHVEVLEAGATQHPHAGHNH